MIRSFFLRSSALPVGLLALGVMMACGGSAPPPEAPEDPSLVDEGDASPSGAQASPKVAEGRQAIGAGDFARARGVLEQAVLEAPGDAQAHFYLAVALEGVQEPDKAAEEYRAAIAADRQLVDAYVNLSALLLDSGAAKESVAVADDGLAIASQHPDLLTNRALALEAEGRLEEALSAYGKAADVASGNHELRFAYADLLARTDKPAQAKAQLKQLIDSSSDARVLAAAGHLLATLGSYAECVSAYGKALETTSEPQLLVRRGLCRHELKDETGARADFEKALAADPKNAPAHYYLGRYYASVKKKQQACAHLQKAAELGEGAVVQSARGAANKLGCQ